MLSIPYSPYTTRITQKNTDENQECVWNKKDPSHLAVLGSFDRCSLDVNAKRLKLYFQFSSLCLEFGSFLLFRDSFLILLFRLFEALGCCSYLVRMRACRKFCSNFSQALCFILVIDNIFQRV